MKELQGIQQGLKAPKGQFNNFGKYYYRSCEDILEAVKPLLAQFNCTLTVTDDVVLLGNRYYVKATATIKNSSQESESVSGFAREAEEKKGMDSAQVTGAASSYARKYALNGLFCIDDTKDADFNNNGYTSPTQQQQQQKRPVVKTTQSKNEVMYEKLRKLLNSKYFTEKDKEGYREMYAEGKSLDQIYSDVESEYAARSAWENGAEGVNK